MRPLLRSIAGAALMLCACATSSHPPSQPSGTKAMGYGMGKVQVIEHDGHGGLHFDERPFVVMVDRGFVDLGVVGCADAKSKGNRCELLAKN